MSSNVTALLAAVVGVIGTLGAAVLTQGRADRTKRLELEHAAAQRAEEVRQATIQRDAEVAENRAFEAHTQRRQCYVDLNRAARQYMTAIVNHLHGLKRSTPETPTESQLDDQRAIFLDNYAQAQMIVPNSVLEAASMAARRLNGAYGQLKRARDNSGRQGTLEDVEATLPDLWACLRNLRREMRMDLGIESSTDT